MTGNEHERNCAQCKQSVINFEEKTNDEILAYFKNRRQSKTCGRFNTKQLDSLNTSLSSHQNTSKLKRIAALLTFSSIITACNPTKNIAPNHQHTSSTLEIIKDIPIYHQDTFVIKGTITDDMNLPMYGASIYLGDPRYSTISDIDGHFELRVSKTDSIPPHLVTSYTEYNHYSIPIEDIKNKEIKIQMLDVGMTIGEVVIIKYPWYKRLWNKITGKQ